MRVIEITLEPLEEDEPRTPREYMTKLFGEHGEFMSKLFVETGDTDVTKEAITEEEVATLAKTLVSDTVNEARAREMAVARIAKDKGIYDAMYVSNADAISHAAATERVGKSAAELTFDKHVEDIKKRDKCTNTEAMARARAEYPAAFEAMQSA
jgi:hypothetical protein